MAHAIWTGAINFGLVTIPVRLLTAVRENSDLHFHFLHAKDYGRIKNERVCTEDGNPVPWEEIVRGYEYDKGQYVVLTEEDFKKVSIEATQSVEIVQFVQLEEIDPVFFDRPYYLEPEKKGRHAYALLREALKKSGKVGIARVVIRSREHLAALKPSGDALVIQMMHWADEIVNASDLEFPKLESAPAGEMKAATMLIDTMTSPFDASKFHDRYREELQALIEAKVAGKPAEKGRAKARPETNVRDLMAVLQRSLKEARGVKKTKSTAKHGARHSKKTAA
jgi:DNA end-binding protein Ku